MGHGGNGRPSFSSEHEPSGFRGARGYVAGVDGARDLSLTAVWLPVDSSDAEGTTVVATCYPLLCRENGFMLLVPKTEEVTAALQGVASLCSAEPATWEGEVDLITVRGRLLGKQECQLVDLTWDYVPHLCKALVLRGAAKQSTQVVHFQLGGASGRPVAQFALSVADQWITAGLGLDPESAQEYLTGEELVRDDDPDLASPSAPGSQAGGDGHLQARIKVLEEQLAGLHQAVSTQPRAQARLPLGGLQASHAKHGQEQQLFSSTSTRGTGSPAATCRSSSRAFADCGSKAAARRRASGGSSGWAASRSGEGGSGGPGCAPARSGAGPDAGDRSCAAPSTSSDATKHCADAAFCPTSRS